MGMVVYEVRKEGRKEGRRKEKERERERERESTAVKWWLERGRRKSVRWIGG